MARRVQYEGSNLIWITGGIMVATTLYEGSKGEFQAATGPKKIQPHKFNKVFATEASQLIAIALLVIVMSVINDQVPEFGKPFTILVLVAFLTTKAPIIRDYFNTTQGKTK